MEAKLWSIIEEGAKTFSISKITSTEKELLAMLYQEQTGESLNVNCGGCLVGACIALYNQNNGKIYGKRG